MKVLSGKKKKITNPEIEREKGADTSDQLHQRRAYNRQNPPKLQVFDFVPLIS